MGLFRCPLNMQIKLKIGPNIGWASLFCIKFPTVGRVRAGIAPAIIRENSQLQIPLNGRKAKTRKRKKIMHKAKGSGAERRICAGNQCNERPPQSENKSHASDGGHTANKIGGTVHLFPEQRKIK